MEIAQSLNGVPIRLPDERWLHLTEAHSEMAGYCADVLEAVEDPDAIYEGNSGELLAVKAIGTTKYLIVVYKEVDRKDFCWLDDQRLIVVNNLYPSLDD